MDVLTQAFEIEGWDVHHLTFPRVFYTPDIKAPPDKGIRCIQPPRARVPYVDRYMWWLPRRIFEAIRKHNVRTLRGAVDFKKYDIIVLESGKPLFLLPEIHKAGISDRLVYRQSDSVRLVLGRGKWYRDLEDRAFQVSSRIILKKKLYEDFIPEKFRTNAVTVENGMALPDETDAGAPFTPGSQNAVYVGLHALDAETLQKLLSDFPDVIFHIIGPCLRSHQKRRLKRFTNFKFTRFLPKEEYMPMLRHADLAIFPFVQTENMKWFGLTSKFLHFMYFQLPIVSFPTGLPGEFKDLPVHFANSRQDFIDHVRRALDEKPVVYNIDFEYYSPQSRMDEYRAVVRNLKTQEKDTTHV